MSKDTPFRIGLRSARELALPAVVLLAAGTTLVGCYYRVPEVADALNRVGELKRTGGVFFSMLSSMALAGFVPWLFRLAVPALRPERPVPELVFGLLWWAFMGVVIDLFYRVQGVLYDDSGLAVPAIVVAKVFTDMAVFTPVFAAPANAFAHLWKDAGFDARKLKAAMGPGWYARLVLPNLVPNWMVWFPGVTLVYVLPASLQLPMANLIGCFWALMCLRISASTRCRVVDEAVVPV